MVGLRLAEGIDLAPFTQALGPAFIAMVTHQLSPYLSAGQAILKNNHLCLSDPEGFLISNTVIADLFNGLEQLGDHAGH